MEEPNDKPLSRTEATLAADWLKQKKHELKSGWVSLWKLRPTAISKEYKVGIVDLLTVIRRV